MSRTITRSIIALSLSTALMSACSRQVDKPMLEGRINVSEPTELTFVYDIDGDVYHEEITTDSTGIFVFNPETDVENINVAIYTGHSIYGAYVEKGKNTSMTIDGENVTFEGDNIDKNDFFNAYEQAYSVWKFKPTPDKPFVYDEYSALLENGYSNVTGKLAAISDNDLRDKCERLNEARHKYYYLQNLSMTFSDTVTAEFDSISATIDPNADESRLSGLINYWYNKAQLNQYIKKSDEPLDNFGYFTGIFEIVDSVLTNEANKKNLYLTLGNMFFLYAQPDDSLAQAFMEAVKPQIANAPTVTAAFNEIIAERAKVVKDGSPLPTDPVLIAPDGTKTTLSAELQGKVVYIDIWATWCGPCCREIPFMEKIAEKYKDNDNIRFISISEDDGRDAWLEKLERDKPEWPQFIFDQKTGTEFRKAMSITGIPRFLLIGRDGRFIAVDAARPSNDKITEILDAAIAGN